MTLSHNPSTLSQPSLFDDGEHAAKTRATSFTAAKPKQAGRQELIIGFLRQRGEIGATRDEISERLCYPIQSVTAPALQLLKDGLAVETSERRLTRYGSMAAVIVSKEFQR